MQFLTVVVRHLQKLRVYRLVALYEILLNRIDIRSIGLLDLYGSI